MPLVASMMLAGKKKDVFQINQLAEDISEVEVQTEVMTSSLQMPEGLKTLTVYSNKKLVAIFFYEPISDADVFATEIQTFLSDFLVKR